jgi:hypothetical protein
MEFRLPWMKALIWWTASASRVSKKLLVLFETNGEVGEARSICWRAKLRGPGISVGRTGVEGSSLALMASRCRSRIISLMFATTSVKLILSDPERRRWVVVDEELEKSGLSLPV